MTKAMVAAGCRFFAGYPITPSSEIAEECSRKLPKLGGVYIQMEDEIASMAAVIGASMGGLMAARALAEHFERVTIIDRDDLCDTGEPRKGRHRSRPRHCQAYCLAPSRAIGN